MLSLASGEHGLDYYCGEKLAWWPVCANFKPNSDFKQYLKAKEFLVEKNNNLIEEHNFFEKLEIDGD